MHKYTLAISSLALLALFSGCEVVEGFIGSEEGSGSAPAEEVEAEAATPATDDAVAPVAAIPAENAAPSGQVAPSQAAPSPAGSGNGVSPTGHLARPATGGAAAQAAPGGSGGAPSAGGAVQMGTNGQAAPGTVVSPTGVVAQVGDGTVQVDPNGAVVQPSANTQVQVSPTGAVVNADGTQVQVSPTGAVVNGGGTQVSPTGVVADAGGAQVQVSPTGAVVNADGTPGVAVGEPAQPSDSAPSELVAPSQAVAPSGAPPVPEGAPPAGDPPSLVDEAAPTQVDAEVAQVEEVVEAAPVDPADDAEAEDGTPWAGERYTGRISASGVSGDITIRVASNGERFSATVEGYSSTSSQRFSASFSGRITDDGDLRGSGTGSASGNLTATYDRDDNTYRGRFSGRIADEAITFTYNADD